MMSQILEELFTSYDLDRNSKIEPIINGLINTTWRVKNMKGAFVLQKINDQIFKRPEAIGFNIRLIANYLLKREPGYLFVSPIKTKNNEEIKFIKGHGYFRLIPFVKESLTMNSVNSPDQALQAARKFGEFTKLLSGFPVEKLQITLPDFHNLGLRYDQFIKSLKTGNKERLKESKGWIEFIRANKNILETYEKILHNPSFKLRVTHHDTKISNVLFDEQNKGLCVIDLDTVMPGYFISDVGDMMRTYLCSSNEEEKDFSKIEIREEYFKSIWNGYMGEMKDELNKEEKRHFIYAGKFMIYMQAIRFLTDYLNNDVYYGAKYQGQNFIRAGNQITLLQRIIEKEKLLKSIIGE